jgi:hypothetical protein
MPVPVYPCSLIVFTGQPTFFVISAELTKLSIQVGQNFEEVPDKPIVRNMENRSIAVGIDGNNNLLKTSKCIG